MKRLETRVPPPLLVLFIGALMGALWWLTPVAAPPWRWWIAATAFGLAAVFGLPAFRAFARARTTINPVRIDAASTLVTAGVYGLTRNPMYLSLTLILFALAAALGHPAALAGPIVFVLWMTRLQIMPEERVLRAKFGAAYDAYAARVRRWL